MTRSVCLLASAGLVLLPDGATAFGWRTRHCPPAPMAYVAPEIVFLSPTLPYIPIGSYDYCQPGAFSQNTPIYVHDACPPNAGTPIAPRTAPATPPKVMEKPSVQAPETEKPPIRPAAFATPMEIPLEKSFAPPPRPVEVEPAKPLPLETIPKTDLPKNERPKPVVPKIELPAIEQPKPVVPKIDLPPFDLPTIDRPKPSSDIKIPEIKQPEIKLPDVAPVAPTGGISTSRYSPETGKSRPAITMLPVESNGKLVVDGKWKIGFYNYSDRDLNLVVDGTTMTLPSKTSLSATVGKTFTWRVGTAPDETTIIANDSAGWEIVIN